MSFCVICGKDVDKRPHVRNTIGDVLCSSCFSAMETDTAEAIYRYAYKRAQNPDAPVDWRSAYDDFSSFMDDF